MRHFSLAAALAFVLGLGCTETGPAPTVGAPTAPAKTAPTPEKAAPAKTVPPPPPSAVPAPAPSVTPTAAPPAGKVVASWALDRDAMGKLYDAEVAKLPPMDRAAAKIGAEVMKLTDIRLTLHEGGKGEMATTKPTAERGGVGKVTTEALTWEQKGKELVLTGQKELKRGMKCTRAGQVLTCVSGGGPGKMIFKRR